MQFGAEPDAGANRAEPLGCAVEFRVCSCQDSGRSALSFDGERALAMIERAFAVVRSLRSLRSLWFVLFVFTAENTESAESWQPECRGRGGCHGQRGPVEPETFETVDTLSNKTLESTPGSARGLPGSRGLAHVSGRRDSALR